MSVGIGKEIAMRTRDMIFRICALVSALVFVAIWIWNPTMSSDETTQFFYRSVIFRGLGSLIFLFVLLYMEFPMLSRPRLVHLAVLLPSLAVAVNNFPILGYLQGTVWLERDDLVWLFALDCLLIGAFEELAFRGVFLPALLERYGKDRRGMRATVVVSSAAFGLIHLVNLLEGAGIGATLLQVGYSFLIGGMCAIVLLKTGNLLYCILLHGIYDFGGRFLLIGDGSLWDTPTVVLTAVLAVIVTAWMVKVFFDATLAEGARLYCKKAKEK